MDNITIRMWNADNLGGHDQKAWDAGDLVLQKNVKNLMERKSDKHRGVSSHEYKHIHADRHCSLTTNFPWAYSTKRGTGNLVVTGFVDGKRDRGRQRETFLTYLSKKRDVWTKFCAHSNRLRIWYTMMMMWFDVEWYSFVYTFLISFCSMRMTHR